MLARYDQERHQLLSNLAFDIRPNRSDLGFLLRYYSLKMEPVSSSYMVCIIQMEELIIQEEFTFGVF